MHVTPWKPDNLSFARAARIPGDSQMAAAIRDMDWSLTPLGAIETLLAAVNIMLFAPFSFALYWGPELTLLYNDAYRPFLGEKHPAALGAHGPEVWQEAWPVIGEPIRNALERGLVTNARESYIPILIDGKLQNRWWGYHFYPLYERGVISGVANPGSDETDKVVARRDQVAAEVSKDRVTSHLEQILAGTTDGIAFVDRDWRFAYFNRAACRIARVGESVIGRNLWDAFPDMVYEDSPYVFHYTRAMNEGISGDFVTKDERLEIGSLHVFSLPVPDGIVIIFRDITEQERSKKALIENEKLAAVGRLASSVAHEINNPLESVTNLLYLVRHSHDIGEIHDYIDTAERELRRVSIITNQTLRFHKQATHPQPVFCYDLIGDALSIYQGRLINSKITVEKRKRAAHPVPCFGAEIRQVLSNLIGNAIDAMPHGGRLLLRSREAANLNDGARSVVLTVADTGSGIAPVTLKKIFDPFFTTKGIGGTGLGLWVCSEIVSRHSGSLRVRSSQRPGTSGTVFMLALPFEAVTREVQAAITDN